MGIKTFSSFLLLSSKFSALHSIGAGGVAQTVEHLPSNHKALSSNPSTIKKKKKKRKSQATIIGFMFEKWSEYSSEMNWWGWQSGGTGNR
jgi:hypothetical protein